MRRPDVVDLGQGEVLDLEAAVGRAARPEHAREGDALAGGAQQPALARAPLAARSRSEAIITRGRRMRRANPCRSSKTSPGAQLARSASQSASSPASSSCQRSSAAVAALPLAIAASGSGGALGRQRVEAGPRLVELLGVADVDALRRPLRVELDDDDDGISKAPPSRVPASVTPRQRRAPAETQTWSMR